MPLSWVLWTTIQSGPLLSSFVTPLLINFWSLQDGNCFRFPFVVCPVNHMVYTQYYLVNSVNFSMYTFKHKLLLLNSSRIPKLLSSKDYVSLKFFYFGEKHKFKEISSGEEKKKPYRENKVFKWQVIINLSKFTILNSYKFCK